MKYTCQITKTQYPSTYDVALALLRQETVVENRGFFSRLDCASRMADDCSLPLEVRDGWAEIESQYRLAFHTYRTQS
ncbi:MAG: hypothetical protein ABIH82_06200 [Candidatus Woesearchaeota archaeon]